MFAKIKSSYLHATLPIFDVNPIQILRSKRLQLAFVLQLAFAH
jgi:hypothetical protein